MDKIIKELDDIIDDSFEKMAHSKTDSERNDWSIFAKRLVLDSIPGAAWCAGSDYRRAEEQLVWRDEEEKS